MNASRILGLVIFSCLVVACKKECPPAKETAPTGESPATEDTKLEQAAHLLVIRGADGKNGIFKVIEQCNPAKRDCAMDRPVYCACPKCFWMCDPPPPAVLEKTLGMPEVDVKRTFGVDKIWVIDGTPDKPVLPDHTSGGK